MESNTQILDALGRPLHDLRISVTDRCNFRCGYCMPKKVFGKGYQFLRKHELLSYEEIVRVAKIFVQLGVEKIRLTGGEPLLRHDLIDLISRLSDIDELKDLALTTNASLLTEQKVDELYQAGIQRLNISLDAINNPAYRKINEIDFPLERVLEGIDYAMNGKFKTVKINMVVQKGVNDGEVLPMVEYFRGKPAILRFIEFMDVGNHNQWSLDRVFSASDIIASIDKEFPIEAIGPNYPGEVAKRWQYKDGQGEIGVIASITQPFCNQCSRARLSAVGELYSCLFATESVDLKAQIRENDDDAAISDYLIKLWKNRKDKYSMDRLTLKSPVSQKVEMSYIGG